MYISMDVSDIFLAVSGSEGAGELMPCQLAKCINYVSEPYSAPPFAFFVGVWTWVWLCGE